MIVNLSTDTSPATQADSNLLPLRGSLLVSQFKATWQNGDRLDARTFLAQRSGAECGRSIVLDLAYEEYCLRAELGEVVDPDEFAAQFPDVRQSLARLLTVHRFMAANPGLSPQGVQQTWPEVGDEFLGFELTEELGRGAFAKVFLASELALSHRKVVIKIGWQGTTEAEIIAKLKHPYIVHIHSINTDAESGLCLTCMPFQGRATLCDVVNAITQSGIPTDSAELQCIYQADSEPVPDSVKQFALESARNRPYVESILDIGSHIAEALVYAHSQGIYHQDIKPSNVLLTFDGIPLLLDFNLSSDGRIAERIGGTLPYMAPEQIEAMLLQRPGVGIEFRPASDLFAWGVLMYELLTGQLPFREISVDNNHLWHELLDSRRQPVDLTNLKGLVDQATIGLLRSCLDFDVANRPRSAQFLVDTLGSRRRVDDIQSTRTKSSPRSKLFRALAPATLILGLAGAYAYSARAPYSVSPFETAQRFFRDRDYPQAIEHLTRTLDIDGSLVDAMVLRGRAHQQLGQYNSAYSDYNSAYEQKKNSQLLAAMGFCMAKERLHREAIFHYRDAIASGYATAGVYNNLGFSCYQTGNKTEAIASLNRAIELDPNLQVAFFNRATLEFNTALENDAKPSFNAMKDITRAIDLGIPSGELFFQAASICAQNAKTALEYRAMTFDFLTKAILHGYEYHRIDENPFFESFRQDPQYQRLLSLRQQPDTVREAQRLVDPLQ